MDIIVQARMGSTRLPGKVMYKINGKTILEHIFDRVKLCNNYDNFIIATTNETRDDIIVNLCEKHNIKYFRGSEHDVLDRYYQTAKFYGSKNIIRFTSDCPLIDPVMISNTIKYYVENNLNYTRFKHSLGEYDGFGVEIFSFSLLQEAHINAKESYEREHVSPYMRSRYQTNYIVDLMDKYKNIDFCKMHFSLDTKTDYYFIKDILEHINSVNYEDVLNYVNQK